MTKGMWQFHQGAQSAVAIFLALVGLTGCVNQSARETSASWDVKQVVERTISPPGTCNVKATTYNNTELTFLGVNTQFVLLDQSGKLVGDVRYFAQNALLPGQSLTVTKDIFVDCANVSSIKILYLTLPMPNGYYTPRRLISELM